MAARWWALDPGHIALAVGVAVLVIVAVVAAALVFRRRRAAARVARVEAQGPEEARARRAATLRQGLARTRAGILDRLQPLLGRPELDARARDTLEEILLGADVGMRTTQRLIAALGRYDATTPLRASLEREALAVLRAAEARVPPPTPPSAGPRVILVVGVNGVGKTTSIGKLAARYQAAGKRTLLVAGDTFRAAAGEQLAAWAQRTGADLVRHQQGGDPGAVVYDGLRAALARRADVVVIDTAGRLHTKGNLMDELRKIRRVVAREVEGAPHETLLVLDAGTGQNGLAQARAFAEHLPITGVVLTKLDGTAKGGIVLGIAGELAVPIRYVGVGEGAGDLRDFDPEEFVKALLEPPEATEFP